MDNTAIVTQVHKNKKVNHIEAKRLFFNEESSYIPLGLASVW